MRCRDPSIRRESHATAKTPSLLRQTSAGTTLATTHRVKSGPFSGEACVEALIRAGFRIRSRGAGIALLARAPNMVMVPDVAVIEDGMLKAILRSAGITMLELQSHLAHVPKRSGFFAKHRVDVDEANHESATSATGRKDKPGER